MTKKQLLRLAALAQGAAVISVAGCNQTPSVTSAPLNGPMSVASTADSAATSAAPSALDASAPDATASAYRPHPPYINAPPRPLPTNGPSP